MHHMTPVEEQCCRVFGRSPHHTCSMVLLRTYEGVGHIFKHLIVCCTLLTWWGCKICFTICILTLTLPYSGNTRP